MADLAQYFDEDLYGAYVVVRDPGAGVVPADLEQLPDAGRFTALRNLLYAVEWWFFGAFAAFVWWRWMREESASGDGSSGLRGRGGGESVGSLDVSRLFTAYRVLAFVVGVLLAICSLVALPLKYLAPEGSDLQQLGESLSVLWLVHGWVFMAYVVVTFLLSRRAGWSIPFTLLNLAAGLIPLIIFWVERRVVERMRAEHPELVG